MTNATTQPTKDINRRVRDLINPWRNDGSRGTLVSFPFEEVYALAKRALETEQKLAAAERRAEEERDRAVRAMRRAGDIADELRRELVEKGKLAGDLAVVRTPLDGVWLWQGGGDDLASLSCPVVMQPETLRRLLGEPPPEHTREPRYPMAPPPAATSAPKELGPGDPCPRCKTTLVGHKECPWYCPKCSYNPAVRSVPGHCTGLVWLVRRGNRLVTVEEKDVQENEPRIPAACVLPSGHPPPCSREPTPAKFTVPMAPAVAQAAGEVLAKLSDAVEKIETEPPIVVRETERETLAEIGAEFARIFEKNLDRIAERMSAHIVEGLVAPKLTDPVQELYDTLEGRVPMRDGDTPIDSIRFACEEYVAAENELPDRYDTEGYLFSKAVGAMRGDLEEAERLRDKLRKVLARCRPFVAGYPGELLKQEADALLFDLDDALRNS